MLRLVAVALAGACALAAPQAPPAPPVSAFDRLYQTYDQGDYGVIQRTIRTQDDFLAIRPGVFSAIGQWKGDWRRRHVAFLLDLATLGLSHEWFTPVDPLSAGRDLLRQRPTAPGANADDDLFETTYHKAAVALLLAASYPDAADVYLDSLKDRLVTDRAASKGRLLEPRVALYRALAAEIRTRPILLVGSPTRRLEATIVLYDTAAKYPENAPEALVRRAFTLTRLDRPADAIGTLDKLRTPVSDKDVGYWASLVRGRAEDALGHPDAAIAAYQAAATLQPHAQSAAAALSLAFLRTNRPDEARKWADDVLAAPPTTIDPWWRYWSADRRLLVGWLEDLRRMSQ